MLSPMKQPPHEIKGITEPDTGESNHETGEPESDSVFNLLPLHRVTDDVRITKKHIALLPLPRFADPRFANSQAFCDLHDLVHPGLFRVL